MVKLYLPIHRGTSVKIETVKQTRASRCSSTKVESTDIGCLAFQWTKDVISTNSTGTIGLAYRKKENFDTDFVPFIKIKSKWIFGLSPNTKF